MTVQDIVQLLAAVPWLVFLIYWIAGALKTRPNRGKESLTSRSAVLVVEVIGYFLIFNGRSGIGFLGTRIWPRTLVSVVAGAVLTWSGLGLAIWARYHLAEYWSARITIKEGHELIRSGPYAHLRHPIYSGLVLATFGSALVVDRWRGVIGVGLVLAGYWIKARKEETMLSEQFGEAFREHQRHTGFLVPRLR